MRLTGRGIGVLAGALGCYAVGELAGFFVFRALAGVALAGVLVAVGATLARPRVEIDRTVRPDRVDCGTPALATLVVRNTSTRWQPGFAAGDRHGTRLHRIQVRPLAGGAAATYRYELPTSERGRIQVGPHVLRVLDPFDLVRRDLVMGDVTQLWVYPRRHALRPVHAGHPRHHHDGPVTDPPLRGSADLRVVRQYVLGDEVRLLHWKATARTGQLMVREYTDPAQPLVTVVLDTRPSVLSAESFEDAVEVAASLLSASALAGQYCRLITSTGTDLPARTGPAAARALLEELCLAAQDGPAPGSLVPAALATGRPGGAVVVLTGAAAELGAAGKWRPDAVFRFGGQSAVDGPVLMVRDAADAVARWNAFRMGSR
jgi:uncharacterized protein (DUF58 family)